MVAFSYISSPCWLSSVRNTLSRPKSYIMGTQHRSPGITEQWSPLRQLGPSCSFTSLLLECSLSFRELNVSLFLFTVVHVVHKKSLLMYARNVWLFLNSGTNFGTITVVVLPSTPSHLPDSILPPCKPRYMELHKEDNHQLGTIKEAIKK